MERRHLLNFIFLLSFFGNFLLGKCLYVSNQVSDSICEQHGKFVESGELQKAVKSGSGSGTGSDVENEGCGWYQLKKGEDAGCGTSTVTFFECKVLEQRPSAEFNTNLAASRGNGRIVGGEDAKPHEFPSTAAIIVGKTFFCAAVILSPEWVATACHCVKDRELGEIAGGVIDITDSDEDNPARQVRKAVSAQVHEKCVVSDENTLYDIAVIKVSPPFELNDKVKAVTLPEPAYRADGVFTVAGWGATDESGGISALLQKVQVPFVDDEKCKEAYGKNNLTTADYMICAGLPEGGKDACKGDSGGPLYSGGDKQILAGIVSWSLGCARPGIPGVYTEVAYFVDWIKKYACL